MMQSGKIMLKTSVQLVTCDDYLQVDKEIDIEGFNSRLEESLNDASFVVIEGKS
jgi:hypothetical protein